MNVRLTGHASDQLELRGITRAEVERLLSSSSSIEQRRYHVHYDGPVDGRHLHAVVDDRAGVPPLVITVWESEG
jgi:hypothetical protein